MSITTCTNIIQTKSRLHTLFTLPNQEGGVSYSIPLLIYHVKNIFHKGKKQDQHTPSLSLSLSYIIYQ